MSKLSVNQELINIFPRFRAGEVYKYLSSGEQLDAESVGMLVIALGEEVKNGVPLWVLALTTGQVIAYVTLLEIDINLRGIEKVKESHKAFPVRDSKGVPLTAYMENSEDAVILKFNDLMGKLFPGVEAYQFTPKPPLETPSSKKLKKAPTKSCYGCGETCPARANFCKNCGGKFETRIKKKN